MDLLTAVTTEIAALAAVRRYGRVAAIQGMVITIEGIAQHASIGDRCQIQARGREMVLCEVVGFRDGRALALAYGELEGVTLGAKAELLSHDATIYPSHAWLGRVVNGLAQPVDGKGMLAKGSEPYRLKSPPPSAFARTRVSERLDLGVRAINSFLTTCKGQRMGIFAGSGIGKSTLLSMMARYTAADVIVIGLIGERGREVQEFLSEDLGVEGLRKAVVVVATGDEAPLLRRQAAYTTMAIAEYFRDQGLAVLCLMDSVTRFAMAQREIGLAAGEPPTTKGYTPTVFAELPRLLERAGPGTAAQGTITGLFTVLVDGDDHNEPIADAVRGILDGHIVLDRAIAERGRYPAINVLRSISRTMPMCNTADETKLINRAKNLLATYENMAELIRIGAYKRGSDPAVDEAIAYYPQLENFIGQNKDSPSRFTDGYAELATILSDGA